MSTKAPINIGNEIIRLGLQCNEKCLFCNVVPKNNKEFIGPSTEEVKENIDILSDKNIQLLSFSGGEPMLRNDVFELIKYAKEVEIPSVQIQTNATLITNKKAKLLKDSGLDNAFIALHSHLEDVSDSLTRLQGGFKNTLDGIRNCLDNNIEVTINTVLNKHNYEYFPDFPEFIKSNFPEIKLLSIAVVQPHGHAYKNYEILPEYKDISNFLMKGFSNAKKLNLKIDNHFCSLPLCFFDEEFLPSVLEYKNNLFLRKEKNSSLATPLKKVLSDKQQLIQCVNCELKNLCNGVWKNYIQLKGKNIQLKPRHYSLQYLD